MRSTKGPVKKKKKVPSRKVEYLFIFPDRQEPREMSQTQTEPVRSETVQVQGSVPRLSTEEILAFPGVTAFSSNAASSQATSQQPGDNSVFEGHDEEQIKLMEERCIVLDWDDAPVGHSSKKTTHLMDNINKGLLHRAFSVFLFNSENKLLLQQRADEKITFPSMWTNTCCSHPLAVPSELGRDLDSSIAGVKVAAQRKLDHELGIQKEDIPLDKFDFLTRIHYVAPSSGVWGEHEIDYILFIRSDPTLNINPNEVRDTRYVSADELRQMFNDPALTFTPWFKLICESYLFKWWEKLDSVNQFQDNCIQRML